MTVAEALDVHPEVLPLLLDRGFGPLAQPETRRAMAPTVTLERAASFVGATPDDLVQYVNEGIARAVAASAASPAPSGNDSIAFTLIETTVSKQDVLGALEGCFDPEVPVNIVDLGLVYDVLVRGGYARVTMSMTSPGCPAADMLEADVRRALASVPGIDTVDVDVVEEPAWTAERISAAGKARLGMT
jgi:metal-sulfur cluster biosynthetic enzyme